MPPFQVLVSREQDRVVVAVHGELDIATVPELVEHLEEAEKGESALVVDLTPTTFLDSTGLRSLVQAARRVGSRFVLVYPDDNEAVGRVVSLSGFELGVPRYATLDEVPGRT